MSLKGLLAAAKVAAKRIVPTIEVGDTFAGRKVDAVDKESGWPLSNFGGALRDPVSTKSFANLTDDDYQAAKKQAAREGKRFRDSED